jgi:hypothetical protein
VSDSGGGCPGASFNHPNGAAVDVVLDVTDHEGFESNTDPRLNAWFDSSGNEIGDLCNFNYGFVAPDGTNMVLNGNRFAIQQEFSNDILGCTKRFGASAVVGNNGPVHFGEVQAGTSAEQDLTISNNGGGDLNILDFRLDGSSSADYSLLNSLPTAATVHVTDSVTARIQFAPPPNAPFSSPTGALIVDTDETQFSTDFTTINGVVGVKPDALCTPGTAPTDFNLCSTAFVSVNNGSFDTDGESVTLSQSPPGPYPLGVTPVTLLVTDTSADHATATCSSTVTVKDMQNPTITCPAATTVSCTSSSGANVSIAATVADNCPGAIAVCVPASGSTFGFGTTPVTCHAVDTSGNTSGTCNTSVTVTDVAPTISSVTASPNKLLPADKKLHPVVISVTDTDPCDPSPVCTITSVTANHLINSNFYQITGPLTVNLLAVGEFGFTYTVGVTCTDAHGGSATGQTFVTAPPF